MIKDQTACKVTDEIQVSPAMIKAGVAAHENCDLPTIDQLVEEVFRAMLQTSRN